MRILHLSQYFPPEPGAVQVRAEAIARYLTEAGHHVTVLTEMPNHPRGIIFPEYRGKIFVRETYQGLDVIRVWVSTSPHKNFLNRLGFYTTYMINAFLRGLILREGYDVVYANSPPLPVGFAGAGLSIFHRIPFALEIQDLWPLSAIEMGELTNPQAIRMATWMEKYCYRRASKILVVSHGIREHLISRGISSKKLFMADNGSNTNLFRPMPESRQKMRQKWGLEGKFIVFYGGILGLAQGLEIVVEAARLLQEDPGIHFVMVGDGPRRSAIEELLKHYQLPNFTLLPGQPLENMPALLSAADVSLAPLLDRPVFHGVRPTKIFDAWACERPVIVSASGEPCQIVEEVGGGLCCHPERPEELVVAIMKMRQSSEKRKEFARRGRKAVLEKYSLQATAGKLEKVLFEITGEEA